MKHSAILTFSFDDVYEETLMSVLPDLNRYGYRATFSVISGIVGKKDQFGKFANWQSLKEAARQGHEIASHTVSHRPLATGKKVFFFLILRKLLLERDFSMLRRLHLKLLVSRRISTVSGNDSVGKELTVSKELIEPHVGKRCLSFTYPGGKGGNSSFVRNLVRLAGYTSARGSDRGFNTPGHLERFNLKIHPWTDNTTAEEMNRKLDMAIKNGLWIIENLHVVGLRSTKSVKFNLQRYLSFNKTCFSDLEEFEDHLKYVHDKVKQGAVKVYTQTAVIGSLEQALPPSRYLNYSRYIGQINKEYKRIQKAKKIMAVLQRTKLVGKDGEGLSRLRVLDFGCSTGIISCYLARHFKWVVGVDIDRAAISRAEAYAKKKKIPNVSFKAVPDYSTLLTSESFDIIICNQIYEHTLDAHSFLEEIHRLLKPDGIVYFGATNKFSLIEPHYNLPFLSWLPKNVSSLYLVLSGRGDFYAEDLLSYPSLLEKIKELFKVEDVTLRILKDPRRYSAEDVGIPKVVSLLPNFLLRKLTFFSPNWIFLLSKK